MGTKGIQTVAATPQWLCHDLLDLWYPRQRRNTLSFTTTKTWHREYYIGPSLSLRWYGHVQGAMSCIESISNFPLPGTRKKGRPRMTWSACVKTDVGKCGLASVDPLERDAWRAGVRHSLVLPTPLNGTWTAPKSKMDGWMDGWMIPEHT